MIEFGPFRYDPESRFLHRGDEEINLSPRVLAVLESLLKRPGKVVSKEELLASAWEGAFVGEDSLTQAISQLRAGLGDDAQRPRYVQTIPKRGYRFIAEVSGSARDDAPTLSDDRLGAGSPLGWPMPGYRTLGLAVIVGLGLLALASSLLRLPPPSGPSETGSRPLPLASDQGSQSEPALSADGRWVAYIGDGGESGRRQLYVKSVDGGAEPRKLTEEDVHHHSPTWSPDGTRIAYVREVRGEGEVWSVSPISGDTEILGTTHPDEEHNFGLSWSPNGDFLALTSRAATGEPNSIFLLEIETRQTWPVTSPPTSSPVDDGRPAFSPDGRSIAFIRSHRGSGGAGSFYVVTPGEQEEPLYAPPGFAWDVDWASDGDALLVAVGTSYANSHLVRVPVSGESPTELPVGDRVRALSVARENGALAYSRDLDDPNIWRVAGPTAEPTAPERLLASTLYDDSAAYSPDGRQIAFVSDRDGTWELWISNADGSEPRRLTDLGHVIFPSWSPEGNRIAFSSKSPGRDSRVYTIDLGKGGPPVPIPFDQGDVSIPSWSADGNWIYLQSQWNSDDFQVWKVPVGGNGKPVQLTTAYGMVPREGRNGRVYYWLWGDARGIWSMLPDATPSRVLDKQVAYSKWCLWEGSLVYISNSQSGAPTIEFLDLDSRETTFVVSLPAGTRTGVGLSVSHDGSWILYTQLDATGSDLWLVEGF